MKVALYQNSPAFGEVDRNITDVLNSVEDEDFDLLVLPELFAVGYQFKSREEAISLADRAGEGITFERLKKLSFEKKCAIVYGFPEIKGEKLFNSAMAILPDGSFYIYQKTHLFDTEKQIFNPGESGFIVFRFNNVLLGIMICFDWRFPESARKLAMEGAQIICHPSNLVMTTCPEAMITRALENHVFTITANRIGVENRTGTNLRFIGRSRIIAPDGTLLGELNSSETALLSAEINPELADNKKVTPQNDLFEDRRPEFY